MNLSLRKVLVVGCAVLASAVLYNGLEVLADGDRVSVLEFAFDSLEKALLITGAGGVVLLLNLLRLQHKEKLALLKELEVARVEGASWRSRVQSHMAGIGAEIEQQFGSWGLTEAEQEVGLLLIKGLTHKDIAALRGTAETTVRQQARAIYLKSGLPGKAAFSAYFLEDLLPAEELRNAPLGLDGGAAEAVPLPRAAAGEAGWRESSKRLD